MANCKTVEFLRSELKWKSKLLKKLIEYFELSQNALYLERGGHTPNWQNVQNIADVIDDNHDLESIKENL